MKHTDLLLHLCFSLGQLPVACVEVPLHAAHAQLLVLLLQFAPTHEHRVVEVHPRGREEIQHARAEAHP